MKKIICIVLAALMIVSLAACGAQKQEAPQTEEGFKPALDSADKSVITVVGGYDNFEALETEFEHFHQYYPDVELKYTKVDDYNNMIGNPTSTSITPGCMTAISISPR